MRMISCEDLKQRVMEHFCSSCSTPFKDTDILELGEYCCDKVSDTMAFIDGLPTVEAEPVKHGKWEMNSDYPDRLICNQCNSTYDVYFSERDSMHYCSNCGCYMRDGGESE